MRLREVILCRARSRVLRGPGREPLAGLDGDRLAVAENRAHVVERRFRDVESMRLVDPAVNEHLIEDVSRLFRLKLPRARPFAELRFRLVASWPAGLLPSLDIAGADLEHRIA